MLLSEFMHRPANKWQDEFLELEAEFLMGNSSFEFYQRKMRSCLLDWASSEVGLSGFRFDTQDGNVAFTFDGECYSIEWASADDILDIIEIAKKIYEND